MKQAQLPEILALSIDEQITAFQVSGFDVQDWADLEPQYEPMQHEIIKNKVKYPPKINPETGVDDIKRTVFGLQKLAVDRISQAMFITPVKREYDSEDSEAELKAISFLESIYRTENSIDGVNIERSKSLNASCQIVTIWSAIDKPLIIKGEQSKKTLKNYTYSPIDGYDIWAQKDEFGDIFTIGIAYKDSDELEHFIVYVSGQSPQVIKYEKLEDGWAQNTELSTSLPFFPCVYAYLKQPVWGGDSGTNKVEQLEEMETYQGYYVKKNQSPLHTIDKGDTTGMSTTEGEEKDDDARKLVVLGKGGKVESITWEGAGTNLTERMTRIRNAFFEEIQLADSSFATLIASNTSADNKEILFMDPKNKAIDLGGEWEKFFLQEFKIVKEFVKVMFPSLASALDLISARSIVKPYNIRIRKDTAEYVSIAGESMSLETKVRILDEVMDIEKEVELINGLNAANANQGI